MSQDKYYKFSLKEDTISSLKPALGIDQYRVRTQLDLILVRTVYVAEHGDTKVYITMHNGDCYVFNSKYFLVDKFTLFYNDHLIVSYINNDIICVGGKGNISRTFVQKDERINLSFDEKYSGSKILYTIIEKCISYDNHTNCEIIERRFEFNDDKNIYHVFDTGHDNYFIATTFLTNNLTTKWSDYQISTTTNIELIPDTIKLINKTRELEAKKQEAELKRAAEVVIKKGIGLSNLNDPILNEKAVVGLLKTKGWPYDEVSTPGHVSGSEWGHAIYMVRFLLREGLSSQTLIEKIVSKLPQFG